MDRRCAWLLLLSACSRTESLPAYELGPGTRTIVLAILDDPAPAAWAIDRRLGDQLPAFQAGDASPVILAEYSETIELLRLHGGLLDVSYGESGERLRPAQTLSQLGPADWGTVDEAARAKFDELRVALGPQICGCHRILPVDGPTCLDACARPPLPTAPTPPTPPERPRLGPCPPGWVFQILGDSEEVCDPPAPIDCPVGTAQFLGDATCQPHGPACSGEYSDAPPPVLYAKADAAGGGDGSMVAPFDTITAAIAAATPGTTILLARGTYLESPIFDRSVRIQGACVEGTILAPEQMVRVVSATVTLDRLTIDARREVLVEADARLDASAIKISSRETTAIRVQGTMVGAEIWIPSAQFQGIHLDPGGALELSRARIEDTLQRGIDVIGARLDLRDVWMIGTNASAIAASGSTLIGERLAVDGAGACGIYLYGSSTATVADYVANHTIEEAICLEPGELTLERAWLSENRDGNVLLTGNSRASLTDLVATDAAGDGLVCDGSASLQLERVFFARNTRYNLSLKGNCGPTEIRDLISRSPRLSEPAPNEDPTAEGLVNFGDHGLELHRALVEDTVRFGVVLAGPSEVTDVTINRVARREGGGDVSAVGLELRRDALPLAVSAERIAVSEAYYYGVRVLDAGARGAECAGSAVLRDLTITDSANGLSIYCPVADVERLSVTGSTFDGLELTLPDPALVNVGIMRDIEVRGSGRSASSGGIAARVGGLEIERVAVTDGGTGVFEGPQGRLLARDMLVAVNSAGIVLFAESSLSGLEGILFVDNMTLTVTAR